jgi:hypothetical protein
MQGTLCRPELIKPDLEAEGRLNGVMLVPTAAWVDSPPLYVHLAALSIICAVKGTEHMLQASAMAYVVHEVRDELGGRILAAV